MWDFIARSLEASTIFTFAALGELVAGRNNLPFRSLGEDQVFRLQQVRNDQENEEETD